jgi:hypothetical protein
MRLNRQRPWIDVAPKKNAIDQQEKAEIVSSALKAREKAIQRRGHLAVSWL